jgi:hypothetical protein
VDVTRSKSSGEGHASILTEIDVHLDSIEGNYEEICRN